MMCSDDVYSILLVYYPLNYVIYIMVILFVYR
jgi:hypothetical protein